jgi:hypothetical protein
MTEPWESRKETFGYSYSEVLSALKHQDDKLNRTLTAIAFLTAAGITLYARAATAGPSKTASGTSRAASHFSESSLDIRGFFFTVFLFSVVFAVTLALSAIGPSAPYPEISPRSRRAGSAPDDSLLFYARITKSADWDRYLKWGKARLTEKLARDFHDEAQTIAHRVEYKVARSRESAAFVLLTVVALSLLGIFSIGSFTLGQQWWLAVTLLLILLVLPFIDLAYMRLLHFSPPERSTAWLSYGLLAGSIGAAAVLLASAPSRGQHWPAVVYALVALLCSRLAIVHRLVARVLLAPCALAGFVLVLVCLIS